MITVQILTKNNEKTIKNTLESIQILKPKIIIGDLGSTDKTVAIAKNFDVNVVSIRDMTRDKAREHLSSYNKNDWNLWIEPWEIIFQNANSYNNIKKDFGYVRVLNNQILNWEIRLWKKNCNFINPIFETIDEKDADSCSMIISSRGSELDTSNYFEHLNKWKKEDPLSAQPYYYQACLLLSEKRYDEFLKIAEYYLFLNKTNQIPAVMLRYYYSFVQMTQKKLVKPTLQNLNLCLSANPLMAEFWCLMGDVYYHLLHKFDIAKEFYENAIILGSNRLSFDLWPMDISKYNKYPKKMIFSCDNILNTKSNYIPLVNSI